MIRSWLARGCMGLFILGTLRHRLVQARRPAFVGGSLSNTSRQKTSACLMMASDKPSVAIIGGGIAGLSCAKELASTGDWEVTVFDTGRLRPGGRCSSRRPGDTPKEDTQHSYPILSQYYIDHAAQILTVPSNTNMDAFARQVQAWKDQDILREFPVGTVCDILENRRRDSNAPFTLKALNPSADRPMYYGSQGMGSIPAAMVQQSGGRFQVQQDVWVSPSNGVRYLKGTAKNWKVQANGQELGRFDHLVVAHNGKCADRLMSKTPAKAAHSLLRVNFSPTVPKWGGRKMTLNSIYSLTIALPKAKSPLAKVLPADRFVAGFVRNEPRLRFLACHSRKYMKNDDIDDDDDEMEVWTILSSAKFAKQHKAPQEFLPDDVVANVTSWMLQAVETSLGLDDSSLQSAVVESRLQLWGAAVPLNTWNGGVEGYVYDADYKVGICGDWLLHPSIGGAWESGRRLAQHLQDSNAESIGLPTDQKEQEKSNAGRFEVDAEVSRVGIGSFR